jgi:hypothetical protein
LLHDSVDFLSLNHHQKATSGLWDPSLPISDWYVVDLAPVLLIMHHAASRMRLASGLNGQTDGLLNSMGMGISSSADAYKCAHDAQRQFPGICKQVVICANFFFCSFTFCSFRVHLVLLDFVIGYDYVTVCEL